MFCPVCGAQTSDKNKKCPQCGNALKGAAGPARPAAMHTHGPAPPKPSFLDKWFDPRSASARQQPPASKRTYDIIWFALFMSLHVYVLVSYLVGMDMKDRLETPPRFVLLILTLAGFADLIFGLSVIRFQITPGKLAKYDTAQDAMQHVQTYGIIGMALIESVCIFGLVSFFMGFDIKYFYVFYMISVFAIILSRVLVAPAWQFIDGNPAWKMQESSRGPGQ